MCSLDILIAGKYRLGRKLGGGSFGEIFLGTNLQTGEEVGIKLVSAWPHSSESGALLLLSGQLAINFGKSCGRSWFKVATGILHIRIAAASQQYMC